MQSDLIKKIYDVVIRKTTKTFPLNSLTNRMWFFYVTWSVLVSYTKRISIVYKDDFDKHSANFRGNSSIFCFSSKFETQIFFIRALKLNYMAHLYVYAMLK